MPTLAWLERHYRPEATVAGSYGGALAELLGPLGILAFDSTHPAAKRAAAPHLVNALRQARELDTDLDRWAEAQGVDRADLGHHGRRRGGARHGRGVAGARPPGAGRRRLHDPAEPRAVRPGGDRAHRGRRAQPALAQRAAQAGGRERDPADRGLPRRPRRAPLPRAHAAGVRAARDPAAAARCRAGRASSWSPEWTACWRNSASSSPSCSRRRARSRLGWCARSFRPRRPRRSTRLRHALDEGYAVLERAATEIDPTLARPTQAARQQALGGTQDIEKKLVQHLKRRQETELGQLAPGADGGRPRRQAAGAGADRGAVPRPLRAGAAARS